MRYFILALFCVFLNSRLSVAQTEFEKASPNFTLQFPRDHGAHNTFQTEWWYYTGHLVTCGSGENPDLFGRPADFGFQLTFFRRAERRAQPTTAWDNNYLAHAALLDIAQKRFSFESIVARGGLGIAGSSTGYLDVWNKEWRATLIGVTHLLQFELERSGHPVKVRLLAEAATAPVSHGKQGYSKKGTDAEAASMYYSFPELKVRGELITEVGVLPVCGVAWMDHEFMTNALQADQIGWDWFSLALKDGRELMLYRLRSRGGRADFLQGSLIQGQTVKALHSSGVQIVELAQWHSPHSSAIYPAKWRISIPTEGIDLVLAPLHSDQELWTNDGKFPTYWEGAIKSADGTALGYAEMTGYAKALDRGL